MLVGVLQLNVGVRFGLGVLVEEGLWREVVLSFLGR